MLELGVEGVGHIEERVHIYYIHNIYIFLPWEYIYTHCPDGGRHTLFFKGEPIGGRVEGTTGTGTGTVITATNIALNLNNSFGTVTVLLPLWGHP